MRMFLKIFVILIIWKCVLSQTKRTLRVGLVVDKRESDDEIVFRSTINRINIYETYFQIEPVVRNVDFADSFHLENVLCDIIAEGVVAIFGGNSLETGILSSTCNILDIPHIIYEWTPEETYINRIQRSMTVNFFPNGVVLARGYADIVAACRWKRLVILYEEPKHLIQLQDVLQVHGPQDDGVPVRLLDKKRDNRPLLKELKTFGDSSYILHSDLSSILDLMKDANELHMVNDYQSYFFPDFDAQTLDFDSLENTNANITSVRIVQTESVEVKNLVHEWEQNAKRRGVSHHLSAEKVKTRMFLIHDALTIFTKTIKDLQLLNNFLPPPTDCKRGMPWPHGRTIMEFMKNRTYHGTTGPFEFNSFGQRVKFSLTLLQLNQKKFRPVINWDPIQKLQWKFTQIKEQEEYFTQALQNKTFRVVSRIGAPYLSYRKPKKGEVLQGNAEFQGYSLDLIDAIARIVGFKYVFTIAPDNKYGSLSSQTKQWDGLVKVILDGGADLAICDLTMISARRAVVDFSTPFMTLGVSILYAKPPIAPPNFFSFLSPFSLSVWVYMATAFLIVSLLVYGLSRMAPNEWVNPHPCNENAEQHENIWNIRNTSWLAMGSLMGQGCDLMPQSVSTRIVTGVWWFFALMMLNSYTANLAAFLTMSRMDNTVESAEDLSKQTKIKYGLVEGGSTMSFFMESNNSIYHKMWSMMENAKPSVFTKNNDEGVERVEKGKGSYAFLMESTSIEYITERSCELTQIGGLLDYKSYGIAMPFNSKYRSVINQAILKLSESGKLYDMKNKWWKEMREGEPCAKTEKANSNELGIDNVGGVFLVLGCGLVVAITIGIAEFLWNVRKVAIEEKKTPLEAIKSELVFAMKFWTTSKPVKSNMSSNSSAIHSKSSSKSKSLDKTLVQNNSIDTQLGLSMKSLESDKSRNFLLKNQRR